MKAILATIGKTLTSEKTVNVMGVIGSIAGIAGTAYMALKQRDTFEAVEKQHENFLANLTKMHNMTTEKIEPE